MVANGQNMQRDLRFFWKSEVIIRIPCSSCLNKEIHPHFIFCRTDEGCIYTFLGMRSCLRKATS